MKQVVIVGLGLIGGSIAKSLKRNTEYQIHGIDVREESLLDACSFGVIDGKAGVEQICTADIIYLCTYPAEAVDFVETHRDLFKPGCIITDTCGIKREICHRIGSISGDFIFVGGHPMAGKEKSGFSESDPSIFVGASYLITPENAPQEAVETVADLAKRMGFREIVLTTPEQHDRMIAFTSQVPHVLACSYVLSPACEFHKGFSAGSYRDVSRVADINAPLWTRLFLENREELTLELDVLIEHLRTMRDVIAEENEGELEQLLKKAGAIKRRDNG